VIVAAITPSGGRPLALSWCRQMMAAQVGIEDRRHTDHVVSEAEDLNVPQHLLACLDVAADYLPDAYLVIEDDDYYPPAYVADRVAELRDWPIVGAARSRYYHFPTGGYTEMHHPGRSSMCATAFRRELLPLVRRVLAEQADVFTDLPLWRAVEAEGVPHLLVDQPTMVGMKGMPGRRGAGGGHDASSYSRAVDADRSVLRSWCPTMAEVYLGSIAQAPAP
jgi:hypothetical protein